MKYEVRVENEGGFELERDETLKQGDVITALTMVYKVLRILPGTGDFDAVVEAERIAGPGQQATA